MKEKVIFGHADVSGCATIKIYPDYFSEMFTIVKEKGKVEQAHISFQAALEAGLINLEIANKLFEKQKHGKEI